MHTLPRLTWARLRPARRRPRHHQQYGDWLMLERTTTPMLRNVAQRGDALELLRSLPDGCTPLVWFDPQHRGVLDRLQFGNEGTRQRGRTQLPAMTETYIDTTFI